MKDLCPTEGGGVGVGGGREGAEMQASGDTPENGLHSLLTHGICDIIFTWEGFYLWSKGIYVSSFHLISHFWI